MKKSTTKKEEKIKLFFQIRLIVYPYKNTPISLHQGS